jgi:hypothetical protein
MAHRGKDRQTALADRRKGIGRARGNAYGGIGF